MTLIELVVVIAIIVLLAAALIPSLSKARNQAHRIQCAVNLRSFGDALNLYRTDLGRYPTLGDRTPSASNLANRGYSTSVRPRLDNIGDVAEALYYRSLGDARMMYCPVSLARDRYASRPYTIGFKRVMETWRSGQISYIYLAALDYRFPDAAGRPTFDPARESPDRRLNRVNPWAVLAGDRTVDVPLKGGATPGSNHGREGGWFYFTAGEVRWFPWEQLTPHPGSIYTWYWPRVVRRPPAGH